MSKQTEALKLALEALEELEALLLSMGLTHLIVYGDAEKAITNLQKQLAEQPAQQEPVTYWDLSENEMPVRPRSYDPEEHPNHVPLYTTPPPCPTCEALARTVMLDQTSHDTHRKPLTHEQRVDLLAKFEAHKHEWHAPAILIDMVEAAHGITGEKK